MMIGSDLGEDYDFLQLEGNTAQPAISELQQSKNDAAGPIYNINPFPTLTVRRTVRNPPFWRADRARPQTARQHCPAAWAPRGDPRAPFFIVLLIAARPLAAVQSGRLKGI